MQSKFLSDIAQPRVRYCEVLTCRPGMEQTWWAVLKLDYPHISANGGLLNQMYFGCFSLL